MESFHWNDQFLTGLPEVDGQHQELVTLINRFGDSLAGGEHSQIADMNELFADLADYARYHFSAEEQLMEQTGLDARHIKRQQDQHRAFIHKLTQMRSECRCDNQEESRHLMKFLVRWLANHILGTDQIMGRQIIAIQAGMSPEEAYRLTEQVGEDEERNTEPLVDALNDLYREVAERNRELIALNQSLEAKVAERTLELTKANEMLEAMAMTDLLTGLPNRRHAMTRLEQLWQESQASGKPLALMLLDADGFKQINDRYGHAAGDLVLRELANRLHDTVRSDDLACRLGGDEFLILCPNTGLAGALHFAQLLRQAVDLMRVPAGDGEWKGSISVGVAERRPDMADFEALIKAADDGVYHAKAGGRNCVASVQSV